MTEFYKLDAAAALQQLDVAADNGLSSDQARTRIDKYGRNELPKDEGVNWVQLVLNQFTDLMVIILLIAAVISFFLGDGPDAIVIMIIVVLNAALGIYQEFQAEQALASLSALQVPQVRVRRDGEVHQISAEDLVPGDIVLLEEGDSVPADGRLIEATNMRIEEAALTGESVPVDKRAQALDADNVAVADQTNMAFMSTSVVYGRGMLLVTQTGLDTQIGNIATMLLQVEQGTTPLQRRLNQLGRILATGALIVVAIVFFVGLVFQGIPPQDMFLIAVSLAVAAVPEGLPALVTIGLSLGASRMVKRNALIRRLPAVETLGSVTTICSDKTGTLTKNEMTATYLTLPGHENVKISGIGYTPQGEFFNESGEGSQIDPHQDDTVGRFVKAMALSTNAYLESVDGNGGKNIVGDTTEGALIVAAEKVGWTRKQLEQDLPRIAELPFSSERKAMTTVHKIEGDNAQRLFESQQYISITKGAPDRLIEWGSHEHRPDGRIALDDERREQWKNHVDTMASDGLRVLGVAYRPLESAPEGDLSEEIERELVLLGLVGILDPARPEAKQAVQTARNAGIRSVMITGDHGLTAEAIARDLGIIDDQQRAVTGNQLDQMSDDEIRKTLATTNCFARVSPSHKLKLVQMLQQQGQIVAMTGDGVNDAPALKQADIGVAMGITGTDVSKGASEMVLTDDNFASIVSAVEEGRAIYDNIRKFIKYLLSSNVGEILVMFVALLIGMPVPLIAIQILWINLVTDGLPAIALGFEPAEPDVMERKPRSKDESIFAQGTGTHIVWVGLLIAALTLGGYLWGYSNYGMDPFSDTLGLQTLSREQVVEIVGERVAEQEGLPTDWDSLETAARVSYLESAIETEEGTSLEGSGEGLLGAAESLPRTIAFTILAFTQMFEVMAIHSGDRVSFFRKFFSGNRLLLWAVISTFLLQLAVIYVPFLQATFRTSALTFGEMLVAFLLGGVILLAVEVEKLIRRRGAEQPVQTATATG